MKYSITEKSKKDDEKIVRISLSDDATPSYVSGSKKKRRRRESVKREWKFVILALVLILSIVIGTVARAYSATEYITYDDIKGFNDLSAVITDRFDQLIYEDGSVNNYKIYGNLIGQGGKIENSLINKHSDKLMSDDINPLLGYRSLETESRIMKTTLLSEESQQELADLFKKKNGCCFAYNYETGEVYTAFSLPQFNPNQQNTEYINRCLNSVYIPGSTMKIITSILAVAEGKENKKYKCEGSYTLSSGKVIDCTGYHGKISFTEAIGKSCNCYFAQLIMSLDLDESLELLNQLGFSVNNKKLPTVKMDELSRKNSAVEMTNLSSFNNIWGLIGQGKSRVNPIHMAQVAAAVVNGGKAAEPHFITSITNPNKTKPEEQIIHTATTKYTEFMSPELAEDTAEYWKKAVDNHYDLKGMSDRITYAKTGTAQVEINGRLRENKLLLGVIESSKTAFYIVVENSSSAPQIFSIANKLSELLPTN